MDPFEFEDTVKKEENVLDAGLIQEIDSYAKVKYSIETFGMEEHPDN
eukprot:gene17874-23490_t